MKRITCPNPKCGFKVRQTIGVNAIVEPLYYIDRDRFGWCGLWHDLFSARRRHLIVAFFCRKCGKVFPKEMEKQIWKYLKLRKILQKIQDK